MVLSMGLLLSACQPTPDLAIVHSKSESFIEKLEKPDETALSQQEQGDLSLEPDPAADDSRAGSVEYWTDGFRLKAAPNVNVVIDAEVRIPEGPFPVYTVEAAHVTQEAADSFLAGYEGAAFRPYTQVKTKKDYQEEIEALQAYLQSEPEDGADPEEDRALREEALENLTLIMQLMEEAPDDLETLQHPVFTNAYLIQESIGGDLFLEGMQRDPDSLRALYEKVKDHYEETGEERIDVIWRTDSRDLRFYARYAKNDLNDELRFSDQAYEGQRTVYRPVGDGVQGCSYTGALALAKESLQKAGISGMILAHAAKESSYAAEEHALAHEQREYKDQCYAFWFTRAVDGLPANYASNPIRFLSMTDQAWGQESVLVKVSAKGLVWLEAHNAYNALGETQGVSSHLLSPEQIRSIIREQLELGNLHTARGEEVATTAFSYDYTFTSLELGYMKVKLGDDSGRYVYAPVWDLYGYYTESGDRGFQADSRDDTQSYRYSYLTINAIDGTVIDRGIGY